MRSIVGVRGLASVCLAVVGCLLFCNAQCGGTRPGLGIIPGGTPSAPASTTIAVSNVEAAPQPTTALISWGTNVPASSRVNYGLTPGYELGDVSNRALVLAHAATLIGLTPGATYHFQVVSEDAGGETAASSDLTFITAAPPQTVTFDVPFTRIVVDADRPAEPWCKAVGDLTGGGLPDIIIGSGGGGGLWWYEAPNWTKHPIRTTGSWATDLQVGDVDGDGDLDIIAPGMVWYENPRPGGDPRTAEWVEHTIGAVGEFESHDIEVADLDGDGRLDVVIRPEVGSGTYAFFQDTPDSWTKVTLGTREGEGTSIGDIDGDGNLDIAINGYWLENPGPSSARNNWTEHTIDTTWPVSVGVLVADVNGDGRNDVVLAPSESGNGRLSWYEAADPRNDLWTEHVIDNNVAYMHTFKSGDVNRDGNLDLITAEMHQSTTRRVSVYYNRGAGLSWSPEVIATTGSHNIRVADIDADGDLDIVGANWSVAAPDSAVITLWRNDLPPP